MIPDWVADTVTGDPRAERPVRHRRARQLRPPGRRQDRNDRRPRRRLVLRLPAEPARRPSGSATRRVRSRWRTCTGSRSPAAASRPRSGACSWSGSTRYSPAQDFPLPTTIPDFRYFKQGPYAFEGSTTDTTSSTTTMTTATTTRAQTTTAATTTRAQATTQSVTIPVAPTTTAQTTTVAPPTLPTTTVAPPPTIPPTTVETTTTPGGPVPP